MVEVSKLKLSLKVSNIAFEAKGTIGLDEFKMKARFDKEQNRESWAYSKYNDIVNDDYIEGKISIRKIQLCDGAYDKRISMNIEFPQDKLYFTLAMQTNVKEADGKTIVRLYSKGSKIDEQFEADDLSVKCIYFTLDIDQELNEKHKITTKYMNGDWYMREE